MGKVGLIAGGGALPIEFARRARAKGDIVIVFAVRDMASPSIEREADRVYWMKVTQYKKFIFLLFRNRIKKLALIGKIDKSVIYEDNGPKDREYVKAMSRLDDKKDYSILEEFTRRLRRIGVEVIDGMEYLSHLLPPSGILGSAQPDERIQRDMEFGFKAARELAGMDIGQTVIVKDRNIVAVEAIEGTDAVIERAGKLAGPGCVMVKAGRPAQDLRWDVPTVGPETMKRLVENAFSAIAIESGKMFLAEKEKFVALADAAGVVIKVF